MGNLKNRRQVRELDYGEWSFMSTSTSLDQRLANGGRVNQLSVEKISSLSFRGRCVSSSSIVRSNIVDTSDNSRLSGIYQ